MKIEESQKEVHPYNTNAGWDERYATHGQDGAGTFVHTKDGNLLFYRTKFKAIDRCLKKAGVTLENKAVMDAAGGSGKFIDYYLSRGAGDILITDFSQVALDQINERYAGNPKITTSFFDLTSPDIEWKSRFDVVFVMEAIFLLQREDELEQAIKNLTAALRSGGYLVISDLFPPDELVTVGAYVKHRPVVTYERFFRENRLSVVGFIPQTSIFNRNVFHRFQSMIERMGPLMYYLDQAALFLGLRAPERNNVKYAVLRKQ